MAEIGGNMGKAFRDLTGEIGRATTSQEMREHVAHKTGRSEDGKMIYITQQDHKDQCDINLIIPKYQKSGVITHVADFEAQYGEFLGIDFKQANDLVIGAKNKFNELPSEVRSYFKNDPGKLLEFMENPDNRDKAIELGLIDRAWTPETDGLGEHIKSPEQREKKQPEKSTDVE